MTNDQRLENQAYYQEICQRRGWLAPDGRTTLWPGNDQQRAEQARELLGLALINALDTVFVTFRNRLESHTGLAELNDDQHQAILREYDELLDFALYTVSITLDQFEHGDLEIRHGKRGDDNTLQDPVTIQPLGILEMFQEALRWREEFSWGDVIGRKNLCEH